MSFIKLVAADLNSCAERLSQGRTSHLLKTPVFCTSHSWLSVVQSVTTQGARSLQLIPVMVAHVLNTDHIFYSVETTLKLFMLKFSVNGLCPNKVERSSEREMCRKDWNIAQHLRWSRTTILHFNINDNECFKCSKWMCHWISWMFTPVSCNEHLFSLIRNRVGSVGQGCSCIQGILVRAQE